MYVHGVIHLGTSGYVYDHWRRLFYPRGLPTKRWLQHYARVFSTVELNATFYRLPTPSAVDGWREGTPRGFRFAAKGSRYLTHMKRLKDAGPASRSTSSSSCGCGASCRSSSGSCRRR